MTTERFYGSDAGLDEHCDGTEKRTKHAQEEIAQSGTNAEAEVGIGGPPCLRCVYAEHPIVPARRSRGSYRYGHTFPHLSSHLKASADRSREFKEPRSDENDPSSVVFNWETPDA